MDFPSVTDFDLSVAGGCSVADDEVVSEAVLHFANAAVVILKGFRVALSGSAIVNDDVFPASSGDGWAVDLVAEGRRNIFPLGLCVEERE